MNVDKDIQMLAQIETDLLVLVTNMMIAKKYPPDAVAAVLAKTTYSIYKTILSPEDYNQMSECLYDLRGNVQSFGESVKQFARQMN